MILFVLNLGFAFKIRKSLENLISCHVGVIDRLCGVYWSEFLATDPKARIRFPALPEKK
jgi:hypothetical protein